MELWWVVAAAAVTGLVLRGARDVLLAPVLQRANYAGRNVATAGGMIAVFGFLVVMGARTAVDYDGSNWQLSSVIAVAGFAAVGVFDDLVGTHAARGLRGHMRALAGGRLTSGVIKLIVGVAVAVVATVPFAVDSEHRILAAVVVAGAANAANLLDLAPGRLTKIAVPVVIALAFGAGGLDPVVGPLMFTASVATLLWAEFDERLMLGDAGANALGAAVGLAALSAAGDSRAALWSAAAAVVLINVAGEVVSFSRVIERVPPLRMLDQLGRRR